MTIKNQGDLAVFSDFNDALTGIVHALGGHKEVGVMLRPELASKPLAAGQWLRDCLNPEKRERLNPDQVFLLMRRAREAGYHAAKHWMDDELGYERGAPMDPRTEAENLQRDFIAAVRTSERLAQRLEKLIASPLSVVSK
jgi:hypothetical protein